MAHWLAKGAASARRGATASQSLKASSGVLPMAGPKLANRALQPRTAGRRAVLHDGHVLDGLHARRAAPQKLRHSAACCRCYLRPDKGRRQGAAGWAKAWHRAARWRWRWEGQAAGALPPRSCKCTEGLLAATTWATHLLRTEVSEAGRPTPTRGLLPAAAAPSCACDDPAKVCEPPSTPPGRGSGAGGVQVETSASFGVRMRCDRRPWAQMSLLGTFARPSMRR